MNPLKVETYLALERSWSRTSSSLLLCAATAIAVCMYQSLCHTKEASAVALGLPVHKCVLFRLVDEHYREEGRGRMHYSHGIRQHSL